MRLSTFVVHVLLGCGLSAVACSAAPADDDEGSAFGGSSGSSGSAGRAGGGGSGGQSAAGGTGGVIIPPDAAAGTGGLTEDAACQGVTQTAVAQRQPADILFALDNSCSMSDEAQMVQARMNSFSASILSAGIDVNVVVISSYPGSGYGVCIEPPLGSGGCPSADTNPPHFLHVNQVVGSTDALDVIQRTYAQWSPMMRAGALKHFVVVTDDEADGLRAPGFNTWLLQQGAMYAGYKFHGVIGFATPPIFCLPGPNTPCCDLIEAEGKTYKDLIGLTGGVAGDLCRQATAFDDVFRAVSTSVITSSKLQCEWVIPPPPAGQSFDKDKVNVTFQPTGGSPQAIGYAGSAANCPNVAGGWYYDDADHPTKILVCPQTCNIIQADGTGAMDIRLGCATIVQPPS